MHDSRGAALKVGDRVLVEAQVTALCSGDDTGFCNVTIQVVTPQQVKPPEMTPPTLSAINTRMLTKVAAVIMLVMLFWLPAVSAADPATAKRDRDAAAVLALEMELAKKPAMKLKSYADAYAAAIAGGMPMIAYPSSVSRPTCPPGAICGKTDGEKILIGYPKGDDIIIVERLPVDASDADVLKAFKKAKARGGPVSEERDPFFIDVMIGLAISAPPCPDGKCTAPPATAPQPMPGPGPVVRTAERTRTVIAERPRLVRRTAGVVGRFFFPWRR